MNPFLTCKNELTVRPQLRSQGNTNALYAELYSPSPCGNKSWTGARHWSLGWHNKLCVRIISRANSRTIFCHSCDTSLPPSFAHHVHTPGPQTETICGGRHRKYLGEKSGISAYKAGIGRKSDQNGEAKTDQHII